MYVQTSLASGMWMEWSQGSMESQNHSTFLSNHPTGWDDLWHLRWKMWEKSTSMHTHVQIHACTLYMYIACVCMHLTTGTATGSRIKSEPWPLGSRGWTQWPSSWYQHSEPYKDLWWGQLLITTVYTCIVAIQCHQNAIVTVTECVLSRLPDMLLTICMFSMPIMKQPVFFRIICSSETCHAKTYMYVHVHVHIHAYMGRI